MRALVYGGRDYADRDRLFAELDLHKPTLVIEGEAPGADLLARAWAEARGVPVLPFPAAWTDLVTPPVVKRRRRDGTIYNAAAGAIRNQRMIDEGNPDIGIEFPGGSGTADMHRRLVRAIGRDRILVVK